MPYKSVTARRLFDQLRFHKSLRRRKQMRKAVDKHNKKYPGIHSDYALRTAYGITLLDKKKMYKKQKGRCAACGFPLPKSFRKAHVDHDHETNLVRELLHRDCNVVLGHEERNPGLLKKILRYYKKWRKP